MIDIYVFITVPESPKWLYGAEKYSESRNVLKEIGEFNGLQDGDIQDQILNAKFDKEAILEIEKSVKSTKTIAVNEMSSYTYYKNLVVLSILWSATVFSSYMISFMTKNFEGVIYVNYYIDGITGLLGTFIAQPLYSCLKIRWSFVFGLAFTLVFSFLLLCYQEEYFSSTFTESW